MKRLLICIIIFLGTLEISFTEEVVLENTSFEVFSLSKEKMILLQSARKSKRSLEKVLNSIGAGYVSVYISDNKDENKILVFGSPENLTIVRKFFEILSKDYLAALEKQDAEG